MPSNKMPIPFTGYSEKGKNIFTNSEECINYYPEFKEGKIVLRGSPGLKEFADLGSGSPIRGMIVADNYLYAVSDTTLYKVNSSGIVTTVSGTITLSHDSVSMIENGTQVGIFGGSNGYVYTISTGSLAAISDGDFPGADTATYQDGFALINRPSTAQFFKSGLNDFTVWDALDFDSAGWKSDNLIAVFSDHRDLLLMGERSIEPWYNTASSDFPFSRREGSEMEIGLAARASVAAGDNSIFWLSNSENGKGMVIQSLGLRPKKISTIAIDEQINGYSDISDAIGFCYQYDGHIMYELTFPTGNASWVYDSTTKLWHERQSYIPARGMVRHRAQYHAFFADKNLVGDAFGSKIYELTRDAYDEDGVEMPAIRTSQTLENNQDLITYNELQVLFTPGVGLQTGTDYKDDPEALISWSDDGGHTWSNEIEVTLGKAGEYKNRAIVYRLGQGRNRLFRCKITAPVNRDIFGAFAQIEVDEG